MVSFVKLRDGSWGLWVVSDTTPVPGAILHVRKKDGSPESQTVDEVLWSGDDPKTGKRTHLCALREHPPGSGYTCDEWGLPLPGIVLGETERVR